MFLCFELWKSKEEIAIFIGFFFPGIGNLKKKPGNTLIFKIIVKIKKQINDTFSIFEAQNSTFSYETAYFIWFYTSNPYHPNVIFYVYLLRSRGHATRMIGIPERL